MANRFLGIWKLIPHLCKYDAGQAPLKAFYSFHPNKINPQDIDVAIEWTDIQNQNSKVNYLIKLDGKKQL